MQEKSTPETDWPHQVRANREINGFFEAGGKRVVCVVPTGGGKSRIGQRWKPDVVSVHTDALRIETRKKFPFSHVITPQGGQRPQGKRILIDECHHYKAAQWSEIFEFYRDCQILGLTATPERGDGQPLDMFQGLIVGAQYSELIRGGYIVPCQTIYPGDYVDGLAMDPVEAYFTHGNSERGFIFCTRNDYSEELACRLRERNVRAESVGSHNKGSERCLDLFREDKLDVLVSVNMISEGVDIPQATLAMLAGNIGTEGGYLQRVGRVLRASPGKKRARLVDLVGAVFAFGLPTQDRKYSLNGMAIQRVQSESVSNCPRCGACYLPRPKCPRCGLEHVAREHKVKITRTEMLTAAAQMDKTKALELLLQKRREKSHRFWWVVSKYKEWFDEAPDLSHVPENEKMAELEALKAEGQSRGYKRGYAYARYNETFHGC